MMYIQRKSDAVTQYEYGCDMRRVYPWHGVVNPLWGTAFATVRPNESTTPDLHDEHETFLMLAGHGEVIVDGESQKVSAGDVVYLTPNSHHVIHNRSSDTPLELLSIFWGSPEANERMFALVDEMRAGTTAE